MFFFFKKTNSKNKIKNVGNLKESYVNIGGYGQLCYCKLASPSVMNETGGRGGKPTSHAVSCLSWWRDGIVRGCVSVVDYGGVLCVSAMCFSVYIVCGPSSERSIDTCGSSGLPKP